MRSRKSAYGFSMVELLVGVAIGLIGCVIIFQVLAVNEGYKRSTTGGADAQVAGALGLYALERDIKMAGYGVNDRTILGCNLIGYTSTRTPTNYNLALVPVQIHAGATAADSDIVSINAGNPLDFAPGYGLSAASMAPGANFRMENRAGVRAFDFVLAAHPTQPNCTLLNAVNVPLGAGAIVTCGGSNSTDAVEVCAGVSKTDADGVARIYNRAGGVPGAPTYPLGTGAANTRFFNLGAEPSFNVYRIINNTLSVCNMRLADCGNVATAANWAPIIENVVYMKAQYGMDTNDDGIVDTFDSRICRDTDTAYTAAAGDNFGDSWATGSDTDANGLYDTWTPGPPSSYDWSRVTAIRLAIVVRSAQYEKTNVTAATLKLWPDATNASGCGNVSVLAGTPRTGPVWTVPDRQYRYRVFETIIPLRNAIWMPS
jgi:type IV pilus assembly protein PilW